MFPLFGLQTKKKYLLILWLVKLSVGLIFQVLYLIHKVIKFVLYLLQMSVHMSFDHLGFV